MKNNIIIDTNVIVSVLISNNPLSPTFKCLEYIFSGQAKLYYSNEIFQEYTDVLNRPKFNFNKELINNFLQEIANVGVLSDYTKSNTKLIDKKDQPFYDLLMSLSKINCQLVTGNIKHYPNQDNIETPKDMVKIINKGL